MAAACGVIAGWVDVRVGEPAVYGHGLSWLAAWGLGFARPRKPWRLGRTW